MKTILSLLTGLSLLGLTPQASAQDDRLLRNDPTYSTHNYKHANKAAIARQWEANPGVPVRQPTPMDADLANYKRQTPAQPPVGGITVNHTPSMDMASRNYKMQRPNLSTSANSSSPSSRTEVAGKRRNSPEKTSATGE